MVLDYYKLREEPFGVTPDPRFLYSSPSHREALASLSYGIRTRRGFMSLIAKPGMGKTTILFQLLSQLEGSARTVFLFQTLCSAKDLLRDLLRDLGMVGDLVSAGAMHEQLNRVLVAEARRGRRVVMVIDEAQNLDDSTLEMVRMLSNFETNSHKLMQIILAGQPQLREKLASPHLLQLRQRISIVARLHPFTAEETHLYISHRLRVAGYDLRTPLFTSKAEALVAKYSEGIPRVINNICFNALSLGCVLGQKTIQEDVIRESLADLGLEANANESGQEPAREELVGFIETKPAKVPRVPFAWRKRIAVCVMLLLQLLCLTAGGQRSESALHSFLTNNANLQTKSIELISTLPTSPPNSTAHINELVAGATGGILAIHEAAVSTRIRKFPKDSQSDLEQTTAPQSSVNK